MANETTGWDLDSDGYTVTVADLRPEAVLPNETLTFRFGRILIAYCDENKNKTEFSWNVDESKSAI